MSAVLPRSRAHTWQRIRRHAVPSWMIDRATERRLAGDWQGACAAAAINVQLDVNRIARRHGAAHAAEVLDDLAHLAPDLLRYHLPRAEGGCLALYPGGFDVALARYSAGGSLLVRLPATIGSPQRLTLLHRQSAQADQLYAPRELWDVRRVADLLGRAGGNERLPLLTRDARPVALAEANAAERIVMLQDAGKFEEAWAAAGVPLDLSTLDARGVSPWRKDHALKGIREFRAHLGGLADLLRRIQFHTSTDVVSVVLGSGNGRLFFDGERFSVLVGNSPLPLECVSIPTAVVERPIDADLVRLGHLTPSELHPLVQRAFFPAAAEVAAPPEPHLSLPRLRVRCGPDWHWVSMADGDLQTPHSLDNHRRELTLRALGGRPLTGCFAVRQAWREAGARLPKALRVHRRDVREPFLHGDTPAVERLLDAGVDPHVRFGDGRTMLHLLYLLPDADLLPRLLAAGLDVNARDQNGWTPLHTAVGLDGTPALVEALLAAGADPSAVSLDGSTPRTLLDRAGRTDLDDLLESLG